MVHFEVYNPLRVTLKLTNIALECIHEETLGADGQIPAQHKLPELERPEDTSIVSSMIALEYFQLENIWEVVLQPRERQTVIKMRFKLSNGY